MSDDLAEIAELVRQGEDAAYGPELAALVREAAQPLDLDEADEPEAGTKIGRAARPNTELERRLAEQVEVDVRIRREAFVLEDVRVRREANRRPRPLSLVAAAPPPVVRASRRSWTVRVRRGTR